MDLDDLCLCYGNDEIMKGKIDDSCVKIEYGHGWQAYLTKNNVTWAQLIKASNDKLLQHATPSNGIGKGKAKSSF